MSAVLDVVAEPARALALLAPARLELLAALEPPASAAALARKVGLPRQRVNYHLRELEAARLVELDAEHRRGSVVERVWRRTAASYAISTAALGSLGTDPARVQDKASAEWLIALGARTVRELGALHAGAEAAGERLATLSLDVEVRFASPAARHAFAEELAATVAELVARHHDESAENGRVFRCTVGAYPRPHAAAPEP